MTDINRPKDGRREELVKDPHVIQAAERVRDALVHVDGTRNAMAFEDLLREVAWQISVLEANPGTKVTYGPILLTQGPMDGYGVYVHAADVYRTRMEGYFND